MSIYFYYSLSVFTAVLSAFGQVFLKLYGVKEKKTFKNKVLDLHLISSLSCFAISFFLSIFIMKVLDFTVFYALSALNFIFITILSAKYLKENVDLPKIIGIVVIVVGLIVFNIK